jgi:hypothetical protein
VAGRNSRRRTGRIDGTAARGRAWLDHDATCEHRAEEGIREQPSHWPSMPRTRRSDPIAAKGTGTLSWSPPWAPYAPLT